MSASMPTHLHGPIPGAPLELFFDLVFVVAYDVDDPRYRWGRAFVVLLALGIAVPVWAERAAPTMWWLYFDRPVRGRGHSRGDLPDLPLGAARPSRVPSDTDTK